MSKELVVSAGRHETRVAILEDDQVVELFHEREKEYSLAGSIHKGRVTRVLPGMQSAFVDIGLDRDAFLYVSDFFEDNEEYDAVVSTVEEKVLKMERGGGGGNAERQRPERKEAAASAEDASGVETAGAEGATPAAAAAPTPGPERRPDTGDGRPDRDGRGDRGGRGRRGRRRRGGRGSSLPDSKFFSPRAEASSTAEKEAENERRDEEPAIASRALQSEESDADFMVLPGESLAKYSPDDEAGAEETLQVESALPGEHPLAGFGEVASWVSSPGPEQQATEEPAAEASAVEVEIVEPRDFEKVSEVLIAAAEVDDDDDDDGLSAAEVAEAELAADTQAAEAFEENGTVSPESADGAAEEEGPEPARIPTSLTATLREQGHRYPHRVSRRMRRKMRGGQPGEGQAGEEGQQQPGSDLKGENRSVSPRREERGQTESGEHSREQSRESKQERGGRERPERDRTPLPSISDLLKEGQEIIVQIAKEPLGQKGARITSHIALPGRFVVYMPTVEHVGVSRKIPSDEERQRLKRVLQTHRQGVPGGFICRTAAENKSEEELRSDMHFLYNLWLDMRQKAEKKPAPVLLHHDLDLVQRILRDQLTTSFKTIWVDNEELYESILSFVQRFQPLLVGRVKLYTRSNPIFDEFGITAEVEKALRPKVWLKSGGYIVINQTEALVAIDINTGKYVGKSNRLEDTIVKINTDAIKEIVRQIRLRDLGGIIVVDFIDMDERKNRQKVMMALEDSMRADRAPYKILQFNDFGLVAITRKRVKQSLERTLCSPCAYCEGAGYIKSVGTVVSEILQEAQKMRKSLETEQSNLVLRVNPEVAKLLKSNHNSYLQEIEEILGKSVLVKSDALLHQTKFDLA
ncbi:MAG TPA: Rne/Rng family ribonuclease [Bryobacteraceae bacterium]|jgi:ribonuclease G|nr:Rne/Rng family ribonuclease [Bryobacteraceae bacterium]